ncbi:MAG: hypothetical protein MUE71_09560 [Chitinophagaceae bacterium]|nr:hypothetical protein [Chitinophagaceae bacterium]MCU0404921.1 hypothetical protein [Chitinophagaceae bacterium]
MRFFNLVYLVIAVAIFLFLQKQYDLYCERKSGKEMVREDEEHLGMWGSRSAEALILLRLRRDQRFEYKMVRRGQSDTSRVTGRYGIEGPGNGRSPAFYPRLIAINEKRDTVLNYYIEYITPYDATIDKTDRMVLKQTSLYDTLSYTFFRILQP